MMFVSWRVVNLSVVVSYIACVSGAMSPLEGRFSDPNHPECPRTILDVGTVVNINGAFADGDRCNWVTDSTWTATAEIYDDDIVADFSSFGGPESLRGTYDAANRRISWEDGNVWNKLPFTGQYNATSQGGCPRFVRFETETSAKIFGGDPRNGENCNRVNDLQWGPIDAAVNGEQIIADFSGRGGAVARIGDYNYEMDCLVWKDGEVWQKSTKEFFVKKKEERRRRRRLAEL